VWEIPPAVWEWVIGVSFLGVVHGIRSFLPRMLEQAEGHVVNTASLAGHFGSPFQSPYVATKFAVVGLSECLHHELTGASVRVPAL
jgi:NAD(P)-dependent dehydrogenase (short-subunit alcohol dehydrogenase family)